MYHYISCTVLFVLLLSSAIAQAPNCGDNGLAEVGVCVCYSGFAPTDSTSQDCAIAADGSCSWVSPSSTTTVGAAILGPSTAFANNALSLVIQSAFVINRTITEINIGGVVDPACSYPGPIFSKTLSDCQDTFTGIMLWSNNVLCGFTATTTDDVITFAGSIYVKNINVLPSLRGHVVEQNTTDIVKIAVSFPTKISISTNAEVVAPVNMLSTVLDQAYVPASSQATISFATSLQWPFEVTNLAGATTTLPSGFSLFSLTENIADGNCGSTLNSSCYQTFTMLVAPGLKCLLTGSYVIVLDLDCRGSADACPLDPSTSTATLTLSLTSADFCATLETGVTVDAALASYQDAALTTLKAAFLIDQTAFFQVTTSSEAVITETTILTVTVIDSTGTATPVYDSTNVGVTNAIITGIASTATAATFDIDFAADFFSVPVDQDVTYSFTVDISVTVAGGSKKRFALAVLPTAHSAATSKVSLQPATSTTPTSNAVTTCVGFALAGSLLFLSML